MLHAGDLVDLEVFTPYTAGIDFKAVAGNMDSDWTRSRLPQSRLLEVGGFRLGLAHGWGAPEGIERRLLGVFNDKPDIIIHGHTHKPRFDKIGEVLFFNPGSPVDLRFTKRGTVGRLTLGEEIEAEIISL